MALIINFRNRENGEGANGKSHFGQMAQKFDRLTKVQIAQAEANGFFFMNGN